MTAIDKGIEYSKLASSGCQTAKCRCMWCELGRLFQTLKDAGIRNQKDLDERLRSAETAHKRGLS